MKILKIFLEQTLINIIRLLLIYFPYYVANKLEDTSSWLKPQVWIIGDILQCFFLLLFLSNLVYFIFIWIKEIFGINLITKIEEIDERFNR